MDSHTSKAFMAEFLKIAEDGRVELAGLGVLAAPSLDNMQAKFRAKRHGTADVDKYRLIKDKYHDAVEAGGLGVLAAPYIKSKLTGHGWNG